MHAFSSFLCARAFRTARLAGVLLSTASMIAIVACSGGPTTSSDPATAPSSTEPDAGNAGADSGSDSSSPSGAGSESCGRYLSCLLQTSPEAYGAAVQVYGDGAACWRTAEQTAGCNQACEAAFQKIDDQCSCTGTQCTKCSELPYDSYASTLQSDRMLTCTDGSTYEAYQVQAQFQPNVGRATIVRVYGAGVSVPELTGTVACTGAFTLGGTRTDTIGTEDWSVELTPTSPKAFSMAMVRKFTATGGFKNTCTLTVVVTKP